MRTLRSIVVLVAVAGMLVGCGAGSTPQGTFDKMKGSTISDQETELVEQQKRLDEVGDLPAK